MAERQPHRASLIERNYFLIRRLHSLTGLVPIGVFVCFHLVANSTIMFGTGGQYFQESIERIHLLEPFLFPVEVVFIFIPLLFHVLLGFTIWFSGRSNVGQYRYGGNIRYMLQRVTGMIAAGFILFHVWQMHWLGAPLGGGGFTLHGEGGAAMAAGSTARAIQGLRLDGTRVWAAAWIAPFYAIGTLASVYHLANGVWTALITWGVTISPRAQALSGRVCIIMGLMLGLLGMGALREFRKVDVSTLGAEVTAPRE